MRQFRSTMIHTDAGYYTPTGLPPGASGPSYVHLWSLKDHRGNTRMPDSPYRYGGKEWNATTSTYDFEARYLSPSFHRFTTMDPLCEKYYSISPYAYCAGNPVNRGADGGCRCRWWSGGWTTISKNRGKMPMVVHGVDHCQHLREAYDGDKPLVPEIRAQPGRRTYTCGT